MITAVCSDSVNTILTIHKFIKRNFNFNTFTTNTSSTYSQEERERQRQREVEEGERQRKGAGKGDKGKMNFTTTRQADNYTNEDYSNLSEHLMSLPEFTPDDDTVATNLCAVIDSATAGSKEWQAQLVTLRTENRGYRVI